MPGRLLRLVEKLDKLYEAFRIDAISALEFRRAREQILRWAGNGVEGRMVQVYESAWYSEIIHAKAAYAAAVQVNAAGQLVSHPDPRLAWEMELASRTRQSLRGCLPYWRPVRQ